MSWILDALEDAGRFVDRWLFGHDYDQPITDEETRRAEGTQHAQTPGEVSGGPQSPDPSPSPGDLFVTPNPDELHQWPDSLLLTHAANCLPWPNHDRLVNELRLRAAQFAALESLDTQ